MQSVAYKQGQRAYNDSTGMSNPYTHMIKRPYDRKDSMQMALVRAESDWTRGNNDARRRNEKRLKEYA